MSPLSSIARSTIVRRSLAVLALVFAIAWMPAIKIIFYNATEDNISLVDLFLINLTVAASVAVLALLFVWSRALWLLGLSVFLGLGAAAVLNTFLIPSGPNVLDSIMEADGGLVLKRTVTALLVLASLCLWVFLLKRKMFALSLARAVAIGIASYAVFFTATTLWKVPVGSSLLLNRTEIVGLQLSPERNIMIISFDQMQGSVVKGVLRANPDLAAKLDGFTFFSDAASVYPNTSYSLSSVLIGRMPEGTGGDLRCGHSAAELPSDRAGEGVCSRLDLPAEGVRHLLAEDSCRSRARARRRAGGAALFPGRAAGLRHRCSHGGFPDAAFRSPADRSDGREGKLEARRRCIPGLGSECPTHQRQARRSVPALLRDASADPVR